MAFMIALVICSILIILTVSLIFLCAKRFAVLADLQKEKEGEIVDNIADLYKKAQMLVHEEKKVRAMLDSSVGTSQEDKLVEATYCGCCQRTLTLPNCRQPNLQLLKKTRVQLKQSGGLVHMNKLKDYYKYHIYMSQAPMKSEFEMYCEAIVQEKIGVVVWLCRPNDKMESYIPMKSGEKMTHGYYNVDCELAGKREEYDFYSIRISSNGQGSEPQWKRVLFVVAHAWTVTAEPKHMTKHCDVISLVQCFHDYAIENGYYGLLVHHVTGVNLTAGFTATYIGRQILLDQRKVNIAGICRYIRQHRHCAFTYEKTSVNQLQVIYMVLGSFARSFAYELAGALKPTKAENELFEKAKKAHPTPRAEVSAWGGPFSYKGSPDRSAKGKSKSPAQSAETDAPPGGEKAKTTTVENSKSMAKSTVKTRSKSMAKSVATKVTDAYMPISGQEKEK